MPRPSVVLVPGSFAPPNLYDNLVDAVAARGYEMKALHYPSVAIRGEPRPGKPPTMYDDAAFIAKEVTNLADEGKDIVLVAHSYGGVPATESTEGLTKAERQSQGKRGGIVRLAYMTSIIPPVGYPASKVLEDIPSEYRTEFKTNDEGWSDFVDARATAALVFSDIPNEEERMAAIRKFGVHSLLSFIGELKHAGYKDVPVSYLLCEGDNVIPSKYQREGIELIEKESGNRVDVTSLKAGHFPSYSNPQVVADWLLSVAAQHEDL